MDWSNERYVRVYTRDTTTWKLLDWRGRVVLSLLFRKVDRAGVLDVGHDGVHGLAAVLELPLEIVEAGIAQLTASRGGAPTVVDTGTAYVLPNFLEAQEAPSSDAQRKRESRSRRRDVALAASRMIPLVSGDESSGHETGHDRHTRSQVVTPIRSVPSRSDPDQNPPSARDPAVPAPDAAPTYPTRHGMGPAGEPERIEPRVPAVSPPAPAREDIARTLPAREPSLDQLWTELEQARERAAAARGVAIQLLVAHDTGRHDLAEALAEASRVGKRAELVAQVRHAIAAAEVESRVAPEAGKPDPLRWFTGAIFRPNNFRRLAATPLPKRAAARPVRRDPPAPKDLPAEARAGPEQFREARALLASLTSNDDDTPDDTERKAAT